MVKKLSLFLFFPVFYFAQCLGDTPQSASVQKEIAAVEPVTKPQPAATKALSPEEESKQKQAQAELDKFFKDLEKQVKELEAEANKKETATKSVQISDTDKKDTPVIDTKAKPEEKVQ